MVRLNQGLDQKLTLVSAPAGFGKTTLLSEWVNQSQYLVSWLSLDNDDNEINRTFASHTYSLLTQKQILVGNTEMRLCLPEK